MHTLIEHAAAVRAGEVSPVELVRRSLDEIDRLQPSLNAFTVVLDDDAMIRAKELEGQEPVGPLHGVPIAIKDLYDVEGITSTGCSAAYEGRAPATSDSVVVAKLRAAGAIIVGKTNQHELACGTTTAISTYGPCRNPWDTERVPGGSSGGSGAAVAAGIVAMAMGSDTGGSIRIPSSFCGVTGLKPTHGSVSLRGAMAMTPSFDTGGPLARSAADCALIHGLIAGPDPAYRWSATGQGRGPVSDLAGVRIGILRPFLANVHSDTQAGVEAAAQTFADLGAIVTEVAEPDPTGIRSRLALVLVAEVADTFRDLWDDHRVAPEVRAYIDVGRDVTGPDYAAGVAEILDLRHSFERAFQDVDALIAPTTPFHAPRFDDKEIPVASGTVDVHAGGPATLTFPVNAVGLPSLALPVGATDDGLPLSAQLIGPRWSDLFLCSAGAAYQSATDWHLRRAPV